MTRSVSILAVLLVAVAALAARGSSRAQDTGAPQAAAPAAPPPVLVGGRGLACAVPSAELGAQLALADGVGLVVQSVEPGSPAARAGLEAYDVLANVDLEPATPEKVSSALASERTLGLLVLRGGAELGLILPSDRAAPDEFLSFEGLSPDHPLRRLVQAQRMRANEDERAEALDARRRALDQELRDLQGAARQSLDELHASTVARAREVLAARESELLAALDEGLSDARTQRPAALDLDFAERFPEPRFASVDDSLAASVELLSTGPVATGDGSRAAQEAAKLLARRVGTPWSELLATREVQARQLGPRRAERAAWMATAVAEIRREVEERISCAIRRAGDDFDQKLRQRLQALDLPARGEIEASLDDVCAQMEAWTRRFVSRTTASLDDYAGDLESRTEALFPRLEGHLARCENASTDLARELAEMLAGAAFVEPLAGDGTWRDRARLDARVDALELEGTRLVNAARDRMRAGASAWLRDLAEQEVAEEDAWRDARRRLEAIRQQAGNDCWKLDGPHLDGRFPRGGEVALAE